MYFYVALISVFIGGALSVAAMEDGESSDDWEQMALALEQARKEVDDHHRKMVHTQLCSKGSILDETTYLPEQKSANAGRILDGNTIVLMIIRILREEKYEEPQITRFIQELSTFSDSDILKQLSRLSPPLCTPAHIILDDAIRRLQSAH